MSGDVEQLRRVVHAGGVVVLSGAGLSTESGIPDYRGPDRRYPAARTDDVPGVHRFGAGPAALLGAQLPRMAADRRGRAQCGPPGCCDTSGPRLPGRNHHPERRRAAPAAGAHDVIELHGGLDRVVCLDCSDRETRFDLDLRLRAANTDFVAYVSQVNPDGDVDLSDEELPGSSRSAADRAGRTASNRTWCSSARACRAHARRRVSPSSSRPPRCWCSGRRSRSMSGLRFVRRAHALGIPIVIVNQGETRGDDLATLKIAAPLGDVLTSLLAAGLVA